MAAPPRDRAQLKVSGSPSASLEPLPSTTSGCPICVTYGPPASAVGRLFASTASTTCLLAAPPGPSTSRETTYTPGSKLCASRGGCTKLVSSCTGRATGSVCTTLQKYASLLPLPSPLPEPSRSTSAAPLAPAFAAAASPRSPLMATTAAGRGAAAAAAGGGANPGSADHQSRTFAASTDSGAAAAA
jgi:hypothetical protein